MSKALFEALGRLADWLNVSQKLIPSDSGVFEDGAHEADADGVGRNGDEKMVFLKRHVATPLPKQGKAEPVAKNLDEFHPINR